MAKYTIYMRNGTQIPVECDEFSAIDSHVSGKLISYDYKNAVRNKPIYLDTNEVIAIIKDFNFFNSDE